MKALVFYGVGDIRYEENWPEPPAPGPGKVKIAVSWSGICGTDLEDYRRGGVVPVEKPHPVSGRVAPLVLGHEYSGRIAEIGHGVKGLKIGQKVAVECVIPCKKCYWCERHEYALCKDYLSVGQHDDGGMAEYFNISAENCIPVPDEMEEDVICIAEPLSVMVRAVRKARMQIGETVTVVGAGAIGLCGIGAARVAGASMVIAVARGGYRAEAAKMMGADFVFNSREEGWQEKYFELTGGMGTDIVFDTGGNIPAMQLAYNLTKRAGRCVFVSVANEPVPINALDIILNEKEIIGSVAHSYEAEFKWAVKYIVDGRVNVKPVITDRIYLADALEKGIKRSVEDRDQIKILITPHKDWIKT